MSTSRAEWRKDTPKVFLETTIQVRRFLESREKRSEIRANLLGKEVCTSSYVFMEFQRTLLQDLNFVRSVVASDRTTSVDGRVSLSRLMAEVRHPRPDHRKRAVDRSLMVIERILEIFKETRIKKLRLLDYLDGQIRKLHKGFYEVDLTLEGGEILRVVCTDLTECTLARNGKCQCRREEAECQLPAFFAQHTGVIDRVRQAFEEAAQRSRGESRKPAMASAVERVVSEQPVDWQKAKGQQNCWPIGDTIIALEAPADAAIYTTDHHFEVICPIVGRYLYDATVVNLPQQPIPPLPQSSKQVPG
jgi:hypothetical protein